MFTSMMWEWQPHLSAIVQAQCFFQFGHTVRIPDETDAKKILTASLGELEETTRTPSYNMEDYPTKPEIQYLLPE